MNGRRIPEPSELIYAPGPSWAPLLVALGIALLLAGLVSFWVWSAIGAILVLVGARAWWKRADDEISRMRREQQVDTAVIPATPIQAGSRHEP
jgi:hypothetical protein